MIRLVVFDWDGTLMDSEARIVNAMRAAFTRHDVPPPAPAAVREIIGLDLGEAVARLGAPGGGAPQAAIVGAYREIYAGLHAVPSPLFDGVESVLHALCETGLLLAVATGKSRRGLDRAMAEAGIGHYFVTSRCGDESAPKPAPDMLVEILCNLDFEPSVALMVGDTEFDLAMAAAARVRAAGVTYGAHPAARLLRHGPVFLLDDLRELPARLAALDTRTLHSTPGGPAHGLE